MAGRILRQAEYQAMPWKNGGGTTTEIFKTVAADGTTLWRLSIADVASDGPFSAFPGIDRWIMVVEGKGMELTISGQGTKRIENLFEPLAFSGDAETTCKLINGPIRDFNLMVARAYAQGALEIVSLAAGEAKELPRITALHVLDGSAEFGGDLLATGDTWIAENAAPLTISTSRPSRLALVTLQPKGGAA
jgi:environmental stress-induced protein Ves